MEAHHKELAHLPADGNRATESASASTMTNTNCKQGWRNGFCLLISGVDPGLSDAAVRLRALKMF